MDVLQSGQVGSQGPDSKPTEMQGQFLKKARKKADPLVQGNFLKAENMNMNTNMNATTTTTHVMGEARGGKGDGLPGGEGPRRVGG